MARTVERRRGRSGRASLALRVFLVLLPSVLALGHAYPNGNAQDKKKFTIEEILSRHLESLGASDSRAKISSRVVRGNSTLTLRLGGSANLAGDAMIVSSGPRLRFGIRFNTQDYTGEDMAFDGTRAATGLLPQGRRSGLSTFLNAQPSLLREGLVGGVLSTAWPLLRLEHLQPKLDFRGVKKFLDRQLLEVNYRPAKNAGDVKILLYFDPNTFQHVASKYSFDIGAGVGARDGTNQTTESYFLMTESFEDFRPVEGLTLPHKYRLQYSAETKNSSSLFDWNVTVTGVSHNENVDSQVFVIK